MFYHLTAHLRVPSMPAVELTRMRLGFYAFVCPFAAEVYREANEKGSHQQGCEEVSAETIYLPRSGVNKIFTFQVLAAVPQKSPVCLKTA